MQTNILKLNVDFISFLFLICIRYSKKNIMRQKKCNHIKLQVDSPSGHCSQLEFHSPPEVQQSTLLAQVQPPSPCLVPAHSFKWSWVSSEPVEQNLQPILCTLHMDVKFSHFILNMKIESALTLSLQKKSFVINFHILTS